MSKKPAAVAASKAASPAVVQNPQSSTAVGRPAPSTRMFPGQMSPCTTCSGEGESTWANNDNTAATTSSRFGTARSNTAQNWVVRRSTRAAMSLPQVCPSHRNAPFSPSTGNARVAGPAVVRPKAATTCTTTRCAAAVLNLAASTSAPNDVPASSCSILTACFRYSCTATMRGVAKGRSCSASSW